MNRKVLLIGLAAVLPLVGVLLANIKRDPNPSQKRSPLVGRAAPPFSLLPVGGGPPIALEGLRGKPVVVNFWATWCGPCAQEHEVLQQAARAYAGRVQFLGVVYDDEEARVQAFLDRYGTAYPSVLDVNGRTAIAYGVYGVPETYFIDAQGHVVQKYAFPLDARTMAQQLSQMTPATAAESR
jgi:cytochrome c biogenesis protein CcmG, thiol:disulfide interchange protein DsbE